MNVFPLLVFILQLVRSDYISNCTGNRSLEIAITDPVYPLIAGQTINAGYIQLNITNDFFDVIYQTTNGWKLYATHMWIGSAIVGYPSQNNNPQMGLFPYTGNSNGVTQFMFRLPIQSLGVFNNTCRYCNTTILPLFILTHAEVRLGNQIETAWGNGTRISNGNWAMIHQTNFNTLCRTVDGQSRDILIDSPTCNMIDSLIQCLSQMCA